MDVLLNLNSDTVEQALAALPLCVLPGDSLRQVLEQMKEQRSGSALVCREGVLVGIFTERDALRLMAVSGQKFDVPIETVMTKQPVALNPRETVGAAIQKMSAGGYRRLPIVDAGGRPIGIVKVSWIVHYLVEHFPEAVYNLPPGPQPLTTAREGA